MSKYICRNSQNSIQLIIYIISHQIIICVIFFLFHTLITLQFASYMLLPYCLHTFFLRFHFMSLCLIFCQRRSSHSLAQHFIFHSNFFSLLLWTQRCYLPLVAQLPHCLRLRCCVICNIMFFFSTHKLLFYFNFAFVARLFTCLASFIFRLRFVVS